MAVTDPLMRPDPAEYMRFVTSSDQGRRYKAVVLDQLDLRPGLTALDVGCGPGTDLAELGIGVGPSGSVIGVDIDADMVRAATAATARLPHVDVRRGDAHRLPVASAAVDRIRVDRALQHIASPVDVLTELRRVCRPDAVAVVAEPDWATLVIDSADLATSAAFTRYTCEVVVRNAVIGRQVARLGSSCGFEAASIQGVPSLFADFPVADRMLGLTRNGAAAVRAGYVSEEAVRGWLHGLSEGPFLAAVMLFVVTLVVPAA
jgi:ubiquinone/menaquinone biosynthesis C-methylase UbiE